METVLVTGGAGFIGSCLVRRLIARGDVSVVNLDKLTYAGHLESLGPLRDHPLHHFVQADIGDTEVLRDLLGEHCPYAVINMAAESHVDRSIDRPSAFLETNVVGTVKLLEAVRDYWAKLSPTAGARFRLLHVSTDEVYGSLDPGESATVDSPYRPNSPYSASKAAADHFLRAFHQTYGLPTLVTHCSNNYGPRQFPEKLVPRMILNAFEGQPLPVYGDGLHARDWLFVEDHCEALEMVLAAGRPGERYHVATERERTNLDVVRAVCRLVDELRPGLPHAPCESLITHVTDRPGHDRRYSLDTAHTRRELGWSPRHAFEDGLRETVRWYLENLAWVDRVSEREDRLQRRGLGG